MSLFTSVPGELVEVGNDNVGKIAVVKRGFVSEKEERAIIPLVRAYEEAKAAGDGNKVFDVNCALAALLVCRTLPEMPDEEAKERREFCQNKIKDLDIARDLIFELANFLLNERWNWQKEDGVEVARLAERGYNAYCREMGGKSAVTGDPLPEYQDLPPQVQTAWQATIQEILFGKPDDEGKSIGSDTNTTSEISSESPTTALQPDSPATTASDPSATSSTAAVPKSSKRSRKTSE